jgi:hypothetical protein
VRLLRARSIVVVLAAGAVSAGCWGDEVPSLDRVGALRSDNRGVMIVFGLCPSETVQRVEVKRTDDDFEDILGVLWSVEAEGNGSTVSAFTVGEVPPGFREVTALEEPLAADDHVQVVVTSSEHEAIPMSFTVDDLRSAEVLVRQDRYRSRAEFDDRADGACG